MRKYVTKSIAEKFHVSTITVSEIWNQDKAASSSNVIFRKPDRVVPLNKRETIKSLVNTLQISKTSLYLLIIDESLNV